MVVAKWFQRVVKMRVLLVLGTMYWEIYWCPPTLKKQWSFRLGWWYSLYPSLRGCLAPVFESDKADWVWSKCETVQVYKKLIKDDYILSACGGCESCSCRYNCDIFHWFIRVGKRCHIVRSFRLPNGYTVLACYSGSGMAVEFCLSVECFSCQHFLSTCLWYPTVTRTDWGDA